MPTVFDASRNPISPDTSPAVPEERVREAVGKTEKNGKMGAYILNPNGIKFATQGKNEQIALFLRQHPVTQIPWIIFGALLVISPYFILSFIFDLLPLTIPNPYQVIFILFWYLATGSYIFINFILWYYNVNIVTNMRVVDIDFIYLLVQEVTATRITQVEDVTYRRVGAFAGLFDYGNVYVQTAGPESNIEFLRIPKPKQVTQVIIRLMGQTA